MSRRFDVAVHGDQRYVDSPLGAVTLRRVERFADPADHVVTGSLLAPMPGAVVRVVAKVGDRVERGQPLLWLEAMKMQHQIDAPPPASSPSCPSNRPAGRRRRRSRRHRPSQTDQE